MLGPGTTLGRYELRELIGSGGMSAVYRAYDPVLEREIAVKILPAELARDETLRRRFQEEARALGRVDHPNLVKVYAVDREGPVSFYAMELINGLSLSQVIATKERLSPCEAVAVFCQFLDGLWAIHQAGIVHRDIKPGNVMLDASGRVILMDFGLARRSERGTFTLGGAVLGTPEYMSPEQASGDQTDPRSDLYSAGIVLYEMLVGCPPFQGKDSVSVMRQHVEAPVPPLHGPGRNIPSELQRIVGKLLEKQPEARYPHVASLVAEVRELLPPEYKPVRAVQEMLAAVAAARTKPTRGVSSVPRAATGPRKGVAPPTRAKGRSWLPWVASVIAAVALLVAVAAWLRPFWGPQRKPAWGKGVPWSVTLRGGEAFVGKFVKINGVAGGEMVFVFRLRNGEVREIPADQMKSWRNEKGGDN